MSILSRERNAEFGVFGGRHKEGFMLDGRIIGFIGAGNMGGAIIRGLIQSGKVNKTDIVVSDTDKERLHELADSYGVEIVDSNIELMEKAGIVIIGVKPYHVDDLLDEISAVSRAGQIFISIVAGVPVEKFSLKLTCRGASGAGSHQIHRESGAVRVIPDIPYLMQSPKIDAKIIRVMPNTPASVLAGAAAIYAGPNVLPEDLACAVAIFECTAMVAVIQNEALMDAVTGLSGSGPAYVFLVIEALTDAGVQLGIARKEASLLAAQTVYGAAKMLLETGKSPGELKDMVTTPGGTTAAGLRALEKGNFRSAIMDAVEAAARRSREINIFTAGIERRNES